MNPRLGALTILFAALFAGATLVQDIRQNEQIDKQQARIEQLDRQRWADLRQIGQLNREVFDLPEITQGPTGSNR